MGRRDSFALLLLLVVMCAAHLARGRDLPNYIKACSEKDPNINECALKNGRAALPYLIKGDLSIKILPMDPQKITEMVIDKQGLKFIINDVVILGQTKTQLQDARLIPNERRLEVDIWNPMLDLTFRYNISGKLLVFPLEGVGSGTIRFENVTGHYIMNYEPFNKGGTDYMKTVVNVKGEVGHMTINLQNLFNGDKFLGENTNKVLNENWQALVDDLGPSVFEAIRVIGQNMMDNMFDGVPYRKVILE